MSSSVVPLGQAGRPRCSVTMADADLKLGNANWSKGLQAMSDWIWSGHLNPVAFPNNLARYFLQIPGIFEQQLNYSTTLLFDEPSFRNGVQVSGFIPRPLRELVINFIGQRRHCWYTMTHHAILGTLTAAKHGLPSDIYASKLAHVLDYQTHAELFSPLERHLLRFAECFSTNPKTWTDDECRSLRGALAEDNQQRFAANGAWQVTLNAARAAERRATADQRSRGDALKAAQTAAAGAASPTLPDDVNDRMVNAQLVELAFVCLQFVALTDVFTALNIPDEDFLPDVMTQVLTPEIIARVNDLNTQGGANMGDIVPPAVKVPAAAIAQQKVTVAPAHKHGGARLPFVSYERDQAQATRDKGLTVGGAQVGVWGWSFGSYFPGGLVYLLMHHPELARYEPPYSLPLLFNEDEWRNDTQTAGFVTRRLKEIAFLKVYVTTRARYGLEHHTMFLFNLYLDEYGVGRPPNPDPPMTAEEQGQARARALQHAERVVMFANDPDQAPANTFTALELAAMRWIERVVTAPHTAVDAEAALRKELDAENRQQVDAGLRRLDTGGGVSRDAAFARLLDHQIAELAMLTGHMDGLGRAMTMLQLDVEEAVKVADGFMTDRPGLFDVYGFLGISAAAQTANELRLNPIVNEKVRARLAAGDEKIAVDRAESDASGEF